MFYRFFPRVLLFILVKARLSIGLAAVLKRCWALNKLKFSIRFKISTMTHILNPTINQSKMTGFLGLGENQPP